MTPAAELSCTPMAIRTDLGAIFVSLELSRATWLVTSLSPGAGEKMSRHSVRGWRPRQSARALRGLFGTGPWRAPARSFPLVTIQEAGLDGFWLHRALEQEGIESHVVDAASIATSRRRRRAKTDRIDGEALVRALLAHKRGEPRVCAMVRVPTPEEEDRRRLCRELKTLVGERSAPRQPRPWRAVRPRRRRLRPTPPRPAGPARGAANGRRPAPAAAPEGDDRARVRPSRSLGRPDRSGARRARCAGGGRGRGAARPRGHGPRSWR